MLFADLCNTNDFYLPGFYRVRHRDEHSNVRELNQVLSYPVREMQ